MTDTELAAIWDKALSVMETELIRPSFEAILRNTVPLRYLDDTLIVSVPSDFAREWLETKYAPLIRRTLRQVSQRDMDLRFIVPAGGSQDPATLREVAASASPPLNAECVGQRLNTKYTFDSFVVGNGNRFAQAASRAVAEAPSRAYNPLFVYGGAGLGKTHLMQAIGNHVLAHGRGLKVSYVTTETFANDLINAIRDGRTTEFRNRYRNIDVLMVDDIQFLAGKERTQEEFFHTFNALHEANRQIIISSDRTPKDIPTLEERLRSRFEWGLIADIQSPDLETRIAILRKKAAVERFAVPEEVISYIATRIEHNIRELEGALIRVVAFASLVETPITGNVAMEALKDIVPFSKQRRLSVASIQEAVATYFGIRVEDLKAKKRTRELAHPRQIAMYLVRDLTDCSLPRIGAEFGGRDHTTVLHACDKISSALRTDPQTATAVREILNLIGR